MLARCYLGTTLTTTIIHALAISANIVPVTMADLYDLSRHALVVSATPLEMRAADGFLQPSIHETTSVSDTGSSINTTSPALSFTNGLHGVDQAQNFLVINALFYSFIALLVATVLYKWTQRCKSYIRSISSLGVDCDQRYWQSNNSSFWPWLKCNLFSAPLFKVRHNRELQLSRAVAIGTLPSRFHTLLLVSYLASNLAYCLLLDWRQPSIYSVVADLRGRSGILAAFNLMPAVLFAMRNNPLIPVLQISYDTFNLLHRWCARMVIIESIVHMACFLFNNISAGSEDGVSQIHLALSTSTSYQWGLVATCVFMLMGITTLGPVRHAFYEFFLNSHRLMACLALVGVMVHLAKAKLPQVPWISICFSIWAAEWAIRFMKLLVRNFSRRNGLTKVTIEFLPAEACRVTFHLPRPVSWRPGCHVHAYIPAIAWWSSHPFSVAWAEQSIPSPLESAPPSSSKNVLSEKRATKICDQFSSTDVSQILHPKTTSISLITKARTGMTRQIYDRARASPNGIYTTWGLIEGLYGGHDSLSSYGTVILFAGGVGITHCLSYVAHLLAAQHAAVVPTRKILLVWSIATPECLEWIHPWMDHILRLPGRREVFRMEIYVTKPRHRAEVCSESGAVRMLEGRCKPDLVMRREMKERIGAVGVTVCGPGAFADSVRAAVRQQIEVGSVDFVEEAFTY